MRVCKAKILEGRRLWGGVWSREQRRRGFGDLKRIPFKPSADMHQPVHVKNLCDARKRTTEKTEGLIYGSHTGTGTLFVPLGQSGKP